MHADHYFARICSELGGVPRTAEREAEWRAAAKACASGNARKAHDALRSVRLTPVARMRVLFGHLPAAEQIEMLMDGHLYFTPDPTSRKRIKAELARLGLHLVGEGYALDLLPLEKGKP